MPSLFCLEISLSLPWIPQIPHLPPIPRPWGAVHRAQRPYLNLLLNLKSLNGLQLLPTFQWCSAASQKRHRHTLTISDVFKLNRGCQKEEKKKKSRIGKKSLLKWKQEPRFEEVASTFISLTAPHRCFLPHAAVHAAEEEGKWGWGVGQGLTSRHWELRPPVLMGVFKNGPPPSKSLEWGFFLAND